jgi:hypothetical protein
MAVEACVYGSTFTENNIEIWYYEEPTYQTLSQYGSPSNLEEPIFVKADFKWGHNDPVKFLKYSNYTCRFTSLDGKRVKYTKAKLESYPIGSQGNITHVKCNSPQWPTSETCKMDFSVNG